MKRSLSLLGLTLFGTSLFAADPQLLNMAPANAQMFVGINVDQAKTSQFGQFLLANAPTSAEFEEFISTTGFDPRNDLREVLVVTTGTPATSGSKVGGLLLAKGSFNQSKILAAAQVDHHVTVSSYSGAQTLTFSGSQPQMLALVDASTAVVGNQDDVKAALDRRSGQTLIAPAIMTRINQLSTTEDIWSVATGNFGNVSIPGMGNSSGSAVLSSIEQTSGGVKFGAAVQVDAQAVTANAQDASSLSDVVKLLAQMVQMHSTKSGAPGITDLLKSLTVTTDSNVVKVSVSLPEDQLESLIRMAEAHHTEAGTI